MRKQIIAATFSLATLFSASLMAASVDVSSLPKKKQTQLGLYMSPEEANTAVSESASSVLFIDVRSRAEVNFLGAATNIDANVPYMSMNEWYAWNEKKKNFKMEVNSKFMEEIERRLAAKGLNKDDKIILMCRSGSRSAKAADLLAKNGFTNVYSIAEGYEGDKSKTAETKGQRVVNGWKNAGLPWSYKLDKEKMYLTGE